MNVPREDLNACRALAARVRQAIHVARRCDRAQADVLLAEAAHLAAGLEVRLDRMGADAPSVTPSPRHETPLRLLDTLANRRYLGALRLAWEAGLAVDRERYGEGIGTDGPAQVIEMVLADVEQEVYGPSGGIPE